MVTPDGRVVLLTDPTVDVDPTAEELADIALMAAERARGFDIGARMALLSYSNFGSTPDARAAKMATATALVKARQPDLVVDGEMMADVALSPGLRGEDYPFSTLIGEANVLVFPSLESANTAYKLLQHLGGAVAIGPILMGMDRPVHYSFAAWRCPTLSTWPPSRWSTPKTRPAATGTTESRHTKRQVVADRASPNRRGTRNDSQRRLPPPRRRPPRQLARHDRSRPGKEPALGLSSVKEEGILAQSDKSGRVHLAYSALPGWMWLGEGTLRVESAEPQEPSGAGRGFQRRSRPWEPARPRFPDPPGRCEGGNHLDPAQ